MVRVRRDIDEIKQRLGSPAPTGYGDIVRNQAAQGEALLELQEGQQRTESRIEETRYELAALRQEITNLKLNLINQMEALRMGDKGVVVRPQPLQPAPMAPQVPSTPPSAPSVPASTAPVKPTPPAASPTPPSPPAVGTAPRVTPPQPPEPIDYTKLYDTAYEDYVRQSYSLARNGFEEYLRRFPDTDLADNAQYWIGECYYSEGRYEEAAEAFKQVITRYPTGNKVPRAMLKAGFALLQLGREDQAKAMFQQVIDAYPLSSEADQAKTKLKNLR
jgi:tol-pal system protein YbgF